VNIPFLSRLFGIKSSTVQPLIYQQTGAQYRGVYTERNLAQYGVDAYRRNVIAYKAINTVARAVADIPFCVKVGDKDADAEHPLCVLLGRPNPWTSKQQLIESYAAYLLLTGNTYLEGVGPENEAPRELWNLRPDRMKVVPSPMGVGGYTYECAGQFKTWKSDPITGQSPVLHVKTFSPLNDYYGMSPVEAAAFAIDGHNEAGEWNQALLQNSARPSGAMVYAGKDGQALGDKQFARLKEEINSTMAGTRNAGRVPILEGGLSWQQMSMSPSEMDWINGKNVSAREIALAFGVAPQILSIPGDNTYSNYQEARQALYEDTVLPLANALVDSLNVWLSPAFGPNVKITLDIDDLPAFAEQRKQRWEAVGNATWLTINEKREATGYDEIDTPEANEVLIPSGLVPLSMTNAPVDANESMPVDEVVDAEDQADDEEESGSEEPEIDPEIEPVKPVKPVKKVIKK